jgi:hypothetical protein
MTTPLKWAPVGQFASGLPPMGRHLLAIRSRIHTAQPASLLADQEQMDESGAMAKGPHTIVVWESLSIRLPDGRIASGSYSCSDDVVTVQTADSRKSLHLGGSAPRDLAITLLRQLADEGKT